MANLLVALLVTVVVSYLIFKKKKPQTVLVAGGIILCAVAVVWGVPMLKGKASTGLVWFDIFKFIEDTLSARTAGMGMMIMAVGGFAKYMEQIGASKALVYATAKPLSYIKSPYLLLALSYFLGQLLKVAIPSAAGLCVLLMATMYPVLVNLGVSRLSAAAVIATTPCLDLGPASGTETFASKIAQVDVASYFVNVQIPIAIVTVIAVAMAHFFVQRYFDRKEGTAEEKLEIKQEDTVDLPPSIYVILPIIPIVLVLVFSNLCIASIKLPVVTAMIMSMIISMTFELIRYRDIQKVFNSVQVFFDGMGKMFATVVSLMVAGETFAFGLTKIGAIDLIIHAAQQSSFGSLGVILVMTIIVAVAAVIMGSGNAPFYSFGAMVPDIASRIGISATLMITPMQLAASIARSASPITAAVVAVAGVANVSSVDIVKRTAIPVLVAMVVSVVTTFILF